MMTFEMDNEINHDWLRRFWAGALTITTLCTQYSAVLMSSQTNPKAFWDDRKVSALLTYLFEHKSETEGVGNFKDTVWTGAISRIAPLLTQGPVKTTKMCQTKWTAVHCHCLYSKSI